MKPVLAVSTRNAPTIEERVPGKGSTDLRLGAVILGLTMVWSYWATLADLVRQWRIDEDYSIGQLVPVAAAYMLWLDRKSLAQIPRRICWWGLVVVGLAQLMRAYGLLFLYESAERYAFVCSLVGCVLFLGGPVLTRRIQWVLVFSFLMVPLPGRIHNMISGPLQSLATWGAVFLLETAGVMVARDGHLIVLNERTPLAVAEACSGLRMLTAFVVVGSVMAYIFPRPRWQKAIVVAATLPVAILCNLIRLTVTALLFLRFSGPVAERFFHDFAGWTMMPMAVLMLVGLLYLLSKCVVPAPHTDRPETT